MGKRTRPQSVDGTKERSPHAGRGSLNLAVANAIVKVYAACGGRGPTKARASSDGNLVVCVLEEVLTTLERTLVQRGHDNQVRAGRAAFQAAIRDRLTAVVEEVTGCPVLTALGETDPDRDIAVQVFVLDPAARDGVRPERDGAIQELRGRSQAAYVRREELARQARALGGQADQARRRARQLTESAQEQARSDPSESPRGE